MLLYDNNGAHPGMTAAVFIAEAGSKLEIVTPERTLAPDVGGTNYPAYFRALSLAGATIEINLRLERPERRGNAVAQGPTSNQSSRCSTPRAGVRSPRSTARASLA